MWKPSDMSEKNVTIFLNIQQQTKSLSSSIGELFSNSTIPTPQVM
jgi:hypothetical protein